MVSVLIPIYNFDCSELLQTLNDQCSRLSTPAEIIAMDDGSHRKYLDIHRSLDLEFLRYIELPENIGRSRIRNKLCQRAKFSRLIFLDCDSKIIRADFIAKYLMHRAEDRIVCGGRTYGPVPSDPMYQLHWKYGAKRESIRQDGFHSNNFFVHKHVMQKIGFDENFRHYGHEDTDFGQRAAQVGYKVTHIDNPIMHLDLMPANLFLVKQALAIKNIELLGAIAETVPVHRAARRLQRLHMAKFVMTLWRLCKPAVTTHLKGTNPNLMILDFYKLGLYLEQTSL